MCRLITASVQTIIYSAQATKKGAAVIQFTMICYAFVKQWKQMKWSWQLQATLPFCLVLQRAEDFYTKK